MLRRYKVIWYILLIIVIIGIIGIIDAKMRERFRVGVSIVPTTYSSDPDGAMAAYLLLKENGFKTTRWETPLIKIDSNVKVFFMLNSEEFSNYGKDQMSSYLEDTKSINKVQEWVQNGGTLVVLGLEGKAVIYLKKSGFKKHWITNKLSNSEYSAIPTPTPHTKGVKSLEGSSDLRLKIIGHEWLPILKDKYGVLAIVRPYGKGWMVAMVDASLISNKYLGKADNAIFIYRLAASHADTGNVIAFDEYDYGYGKDKTLWDHLNAPSQLVIIQVLLLIAVIMFGLSRRFGLPLRSVRKEPSVGEYVTAMGETYRKAHATHIALETIFKDTLRRLANKVGAPANTPYEVLILQSPAGLKVVLERAWDALSKPLDEAHMLELIRKLDVEANASLGKKE
jgi:hypothetical protein